MRKLFTLVTMTFILSVIVNFSNAQCIKTSCNGSSNTGTYSSAIGYQTNSTGNYAFSSGNQSSASGESSTALGHLSIASGIYSFAVGYKPQAQAQTAISIGYETKAKFAKSFAIGEMSETNAVQSYAIGQNCVTNASGSIAIGRYMQTNASGAIALGSSTSQGSLVNGINNSLMIGFNSTVPTLFVGPSPSYNSSGNVGINTTAPTQKLDIDGNIRLRTNAIIGTWSDNSLTFNTNSAARMTVSADGNVGINTTAPTQKLDIDGNIRLRNNAIIGTWSDNSLTFNTYSTARMVILADGRVGIGNSDPTQKLDIDGNIRLRNNATIGTWSSNSLTFNTNSAARLVIGANGNVGVGGGDPVAKFQVTDGDIFVEDIDRGIIMKSPDGNCWRGTLNNQGQLEFTPLPDCLTTAVSENKLEDNPIFLISPNPASGIIQINSTPEELKVFSEYSLFDSAGNQLKTGKFDKTTFSINIQGLAAGTYILNFSGTRKFWSEKVIIK